MGYQAAAARHGLCGNCAGKVSSPVSEKTLYDLAYSHGLMLLKLPRTCIFLRVPKVTINRYERKKAGRALPW
jgi:hypothetical protein